MYNCQDLKRKRGGRRRRGQLKDHGPDYKNVFTREDGDDIQEMEELGLAGIRRVGRRPDLPPAPLPGVHLPSDLPHILAVPQPGAAPVPAAPAGACGLGPVYENQRALDTVVEEEEEVPINPRRPPRSRPSQETFRPIVRRSGRARRGVEEELKEVFGMSRWSLDTSSPTAPSQSTTSSPRARSEPGEEYEEMSPGQSRSQSRRQTGDQ